MPDFTPTKMKYYYMAPCSKPYQKNGETNYFPNPQTTIYTVLYHKTLYMKLRT